MTEPAAISALLSASAVVGALTTSQVVSLRVDVAKLRAQVAKRTPAQKQDDAQTRTALDSLAEYKARWSALWVVATLQWVVVTTLLATAGWLAFPRQAGVWVSSQVPFFLAVCALGLALVLVPVVLAVLTWLAMSSVEKLLGG